MRREIASVPTACIRLLSWVSSISPAAASSASDNAIAPSSPIRLRLTSSRRSLHASARTPAPISAAPGSPISLSEMLSVVRRGQPPDASMRAIAGASVTAGIARQIERGQGPARLLLDPGCGKYGRALSAQGAVREPQCAECWVHSVNQLHQLRRALAKRIL